MRTIFRLLTAGAVSAMSIGPVLAQTTPAPDADPVWLWRYGWGMGGMMFGGGLMMLIFWGGIILLAVLLMRWVGGIGTHESASRSRQTPLEILQERFARGEIDKQEYDERRGTLTSR
jgi:putative membrane protein